MSRVCQINKIQCSQIELRTKANRSGIKAIQTMVSRALPGKKSTVGIGTETGGIRMARRKDLQCTLTRADKSREKGTTLLSKGTEGLRGAGTIGGMRAMTTIHRITKRRNLREGDTGKDIKAMKTTLTLAIHASRSVASQEQTTGLARVVKRRR